MKSTSLRPQALRKNIPSLFFAGILSVLFLRPFLASISAAAETNLLKNAGIEETAADPANPANWSTKNGSAEKVTVTGREAHSGRQCLIIPKRSAVEQSIKMASAGAYLARCWVKSDVEQRVTFILQDPARPWAAYNYSEIKVPKGQWIQIEAFCALDQEGSLELTLGGMSQDYRIYHGAGSDMSSPILADDFELVRCESKTTPAVAIWDSKKELGDKMDWGAKSQWAAVGGSSHLFEGTPVFQSRQIAGMIRKEDGGLALFAIQEAGLKPRGTIVPSPAFKVASCSRVTSADRNGIHVASEDGKQSYTAWLMPAGIVRIESAEVPRFIIKECPMRYGILPSFTGSDICYSPAKMSPDKEVNIPSTQWFVGLLDGNESMLVAAWDADSQVVAMGLSGNGANRMIDSFSIGTGKGGFAVSFVEHPNIWHKEPLQEDWLGEYTTIGWERPFQARWMGQFFVSPGGEPSFHEPYMAYSFPIANMKTRMWGVWFEDWNHYPFSFDGPHTIFHFEKSFAPNGDALIYFLEPAAADVISPCEIVELALGKEKAAALFDLDANRIRKLAYSTPDEFGYDRPVCATTTRLSHIKQDEKGTVGVNLATHLYEFIRGIRGRVDQYAASFAQMKTYLKNERAVHPEMQSYLAELEAIVDEGQSKIVKVYATPLPAIQAKTDAMKKLLEQGKGDGFDCGNLDVRGPAGTQDDLCRRYNRLVLRLSQTAAQKCGDSPEKAVVAKTIWNQSREVLRQPTRWEPRRTLYFFEP